MAAGNNAASESSATLRTEDDLIEAALRQEFVPPAARPPAPSLPERIGAYKVIRQIGTGGMGVVYEAEQERPIRRRVALKVIKLGMDTREVVARFEAERQALALMDHPSIAKVYDAGATDEGRPYFAMEYVAGVRITEYCDQYSLTVAERLKLFMEVCHAIQHAHQKGIIHRDLKPSNVLVAVQDDRPMPKVIDFGIAKAIDQRLTEETIFTQQGQLIGTPEHMSPEQAALSPDLDTRTDIYSLGVLLYELLVGVLPYGPTFLRSRTFTEIQRIIRLEEPLRPSTRLGAPGLDPLSLAETRNTDPAALRRQLRGDLDWITMKALEKDRARRYASAGELAADIQRHLNHEPVLAGPPSTVYRVRKFVRRNRGLVAGATAVFVVLVAGVVTSTLFAVREAGARKEALWQAYLGNIAAAHAALDGNEVGAARRYLDKTARELRNWEWRYLDAASDQSLAVLRGHEGNVWSVAFSPDGTLLASGAEDKTIRIWDVATGRERRVLRGHGDIVYSVAFHPDGRRLASGSQDGSVRVWDVSTGRERVPPMRLAKPVYGVAFSPDGAHLATAGNNGSLCLWSISTAPGSLQEPLALAGHLSSVFSVAFSPDAQRLTSAGYDRTVRIWNVATGKQLNVLEGHTDFVRSVAFSPDGIHVASGSKDGTVRIWDASTGKGVRIPPGHKGVVQSVAYSPDGNTLATAADDGTVRLWDPATSETPAVLLGHIGMVQSVTFSPDGQRLASACRQDRTIRLWSTSMRNAQTVLPHKGEANRVTFSADGTRLVSQSRTGGPAVYLWDSASGTQLITLEENGAAFVAESLSGDGTRLAAVSHYGTLHLSDVHTGVAKQVPLQGLEQDVSRVITAAAFSPDGTRLAAAVQDTTLALWDVPAGRKLADLAGPPGEVTCVAFSPNGRRLASGSGDGSVRIWDGAGGEALVTLEGDEGTVRSVTYSPDGRRLASVSDQGGRLWDVSGDSTAPTEPHVLRSREGSISNRLGIRFSPDGTRLAAGCGTSGAVVIWDAASGREVHILRGHTGEVWALAFSPDGTRLATGAEDHTVRLWDLATGDETLTLRGHENTVSKLAYSPDGTRLASASLDKTVRIWDATPYRARYEARAAAAGPTPGR